MTGLERQAAFQDICVDILHEANRASIKWPPFHSVHEGYAVILEELDELWDESKLKVPSKERLRKEAIHVAAMAVRFAAELCPLSLPSE